MFLHVLFLLLRVSIQVLKLLFAIIYYYYHHYHQLVDIIDGHNMHQTYL